MTAASAAPWPAMFFQGAFAQGSSGGSSGVVPGTHDCQMTAMSDGNVGRCSRPPGSSGRACCKAPSYTAGEAAAVHTAVEADGGSAAGTTLSCSSCSWCGCSSQRVTNWSACDDVMRIRRQQVPLHTSGGASAIRMNTASSRDGSRSCNSSEVDAALCGRRGLPYNPLRKLYRRLLEQYSGTPLKHRTEGLGTGH